MIYTVYFISGTSGRKIQCAVFLDESEALEYATSQGSSYIVSPVDSWDEWNIIRNREESTK